MGNAAWDIRLCLDICVRPLRRDQGHLALRAQYSDSNACGPYLSSLSFYESVGSWIRVAIEALLETR